MSYFKLYYHTLYSALYCSQRTIAENHIGAFSVYLRLLQATLISAFYQNSTLTRPYPHVFFCFYRTQYMPHNLIRELKKSAGNYIREYRNFFPMFNDGKRLLCHPGASKAEKRQDCQLYQEPEGAPQEGVFHDEPRQIMVGM